MNRYILPAFGDRRVDAIGAKDVRNWFDDLSATRAGSRTGRWGAVVDDEARGSARTAARGLQPVQGTAAAQDGLRGALTLTDDEFAALGRALDAAEAESSGRRRSAALPALHGARKSEALRLKWEHVHGDRAVAARQKDRLLFCSGTVEAIQCHVMPN